MKNKNLLPKITFVLLLVCSPIAAQEWHWQRDDLVLNPSGLDLRNAVSWAWGDLDRDGYVDILVRKSNYFDNGRLVAYRGRASAEPPYWVEAPELLAGLVESESSAGISVADLDGDSLPDIVTRIRQVPHWRFLYWQRDRFGVWKSDSSIFRNLVFKENLDFYDEDPFFADTDADGDLDMLVNGPADFRQVNLRFFENEGTPQHPMWREDSTHLEFVYQNRVGYNTWSAMLMKVNEDSLLDLAMTYDVEGYYDVAVYPGSLDSLGTLKWSGNYIQLALVGSGYVRKLLPYDLKKNGRQALIALESGTGRVYLKSDTDEAFFDKKYFRLGPMRFQSISSAIPFDHGKDGEIDLLAIGHFEGFEGNATSIQACKRDTLSGMILWRKTDWLGNQYGYGDVFDFKAQLTDLDNNGLFDFVTSKFLSPDNFDAFENPDSDFRKEWTPREDLIKPFIPDPSERDTTYFDPSFADLDGDGDLDLLIAELLFIETESGRARYKFFENSLISGSVSWKEKDEWWSGIEKIVYTRSNLFYADLHGNFGNLDKDGDADLVFGTREGGLLFYENVGSTTSPAWALRPDVFAGIDVGDFANPSFGDFDNDGRIDLFVGNAGGELFFFRNEMIVGIEEQLADVPNNFYLYQNYPNPFNAGTIITYEIPRAGHVRLTIYDLLGREVATLVDKIQNAGKYRAVWNSGGVATGIYFYELQLENTTHRKKLAVVR
jgi:hypothetical protein